MTEIVNCAASHMIEVTYEVLHPEDVADLPELDHMCISCGEEFDNHLQLEEHLQRDHNLLETWCYVCGVTRLNTMQQKSNHMKKHGNERDLYYRTYTLISVSCLHCGVQFESMKALQMHLLCNHSDKTRGRDYSSELLVDNGECSSSHQHLKDMDTAGAIASNGKDKARRKRKKKLWKCSNCEEFYTYGEGQRSHYLEKHKDLMVSCTFCGIMYQSASKLSKHQSKCEFQDSVKRDIFGLEYIYLWQRVAADRVWKEKMIRECDPKIINRFLLSDKPLTDLLTMVPPPKKFFS